MYARQPKGALRARSGHNGRKSKTIPLPGNLRRFMPIGGTPTEKRKSGKADVQRKRGRAGIRPKRQNARTFWKFRPASFDCVLMPGRKKADCQKIPTVG